MSRRIGLTALAIAVLAHGAVALIPLPDREQPRPPVRIAAILAPGAIPEPAPKPASQPTPTKAEPETKPESRPEAKPEPEPEAANNARAAHPARSRREPVAPPTPPAPEDAVDIEQPDLEPDAESPHASPPPSSPTIAPSPALLDDMPSSLDPGLAKPAGSPSPFDPRAYAVRARQRVDSHKRYPARARRLGHEGIATVRIVVRPNGELARRPRLVASSGVAALDREALRMASAAAPFATHPSTAALAIDIPVRFSVAE